MPIQSRSYYYQYKNPIYAVDVETTGLDPKIHDVIQVSILPLTVDYRPDKSKLPYNIHIKPMRPENIDPGAMKVNKVRIAEIINIGMDSFQAADLLDEWFDKLDLGEGIRITPLGHNYGFDKGFLEEWMGKLSYNRIFHYAYRDTMKAALYINDRAASNNDPLPYNSMSLKSIAERHGITQVSAHDSLSDCVTTAEVYHLMMGY